MDFERLERAWQGPANSPTEAAAAYVTDEVMHTLKRRREAALWFNRLIGLVLIGWTLTIGYRVVTNPFPFDLTKEWAVLPLFALPWLGLYLISRQQTRHMLAHPDPYASVAATLRALLDENRMARRRLRTTSAIMAVAIAVLALVLHQLVEVGKMTTTNALQGAILFGAILGSIALYKAWHYVRVLQPEAERLERLIAEYAP